ncbi:MAG: rod shape-determining protein MreC [Desulfosalsimonas sp.]|uniref:rod shape-determining protein MreC n=1 Tax=Desulfosalsimonas sp. TaxID=3073848 RepID=UPI0039708078
MFSKKTMVAAGAIILIVLNGIVFSFNYIRKSSFQAAAVETALFFVSPVQEAVTGVIDTGEGIWRQYFYMVGAARENQNLRRDLARARQRIHELKELEKTNQRLTRLVDFHAGSALEMQAAEVVAKDPSPWYHTVIINKGRAHGVKRASPVVVPDGVVGQVIDLSERYAKVLLIIDRNSAVDALVQRTRARGVSIGSADQGCRFEFVLRKQDIEVGDQIITSGLDGIYPKGLRLGWVSKVIRRNSGIFQEIQITPNVNFHKLEEVLVVLDPPEIDEVLDQ